MRIFRITFLFLAASSISSSAWAQTYGPNNPSTTANNTSIGTNNWSNPNNSVSSNNSRSTVTTRGTSNYLQDTNFLFAVPLTNTIDGIQVDIERRCQAPAPANAVAILDGWTTGLTKSISAGTDRCLVVIASTENGNGPTDVTALTYGGQAMTQVGEYTVGNAGGFNNRIEVWILLNAGIAAATNTTLIPTISAASFVENVQLYSSAVFQYVDQYNPVYDIESSSLIGTTTPYQIGTAINTLSRSMSVSAILCGENTTPQVANGGTNTYTINSGFTEGLDIYFSNPGFATSGSSLQIATDASNAVGTEQPTFTFNGTPNRQVAVAFSLRGATAVDNSVRLVKGGTITGSNYAKPTVSWPTGDTYETYGGATDLWGTTWTPADINDPNFGVVLSAIVQGNSLQVDHISITVYTTSAPMPIELLSFTGNVSDGQVQLEWQTVTETNNDFFTIERADDELDFEPILTIDGAGNSKEPIFYSASDRDVLFKTTYYRLKQTDFDGKYTYSNVIAVNTSELVNEMVIFPNPANTTVSVVNFSDDDLNIRIVSVTGVEMLNMKVLKSLNTIDVSSIPQGLYVVELVRGNTRKTQKIKIDP